MLIGLSSSLHHESPEAWAVKMKELGCKSVVFPVDYLAPEELIADYLSAAKKHELFIAEVGIWRNVFAIDRLEREKARNHAVGQLKLADQIGARCCVNVAGTYGGPLWDGGYRENFSQECWETTISYVQKLIDEVKPNQTKFCIEPMPWMIPTGPDEYCRLMQKVDRESFRVHLDIVNMINSAERYFFMDEFIDECFEKLGEYICSCHLKDIHLSEELTFQLQETACGNGELNIKKYLNKIESCSKDLPVIIEHLESDEEYISSLRYILSLLN